MRERLRLVRTVEAREEELRRVRAELPADSSPDRLGELLRGYEQQFVADDGRETEIAATRRTEAARRVREEEQERLRVWREAFRQAAPIADWEEAWRARDEEAVLSVRDWLDGMYGRRHLMLFGANGCGKTIACATAVKHWTEPGKERGSVAWLLAEELTVAVLYPTIPGAKKLARNNVIDDIGDEKSPDFWLALKYLLEQQERRLLMSTNLLIRREKGVAGQVFRERYPKKLVDRLDEKAMAIELRGGSLRGGGGGFK